MAAERSGTAIKALELLATLGNYPQGATAGDITLAADYPLSTTYRLLNTLVDAGFAEYEADRKRYRLGLRIYQLGQKIAHARGFDGAALPILKRLSELTAESSILHVLDQDSSLTVHKIDGPQFRTTTDPGDRVPLHTTASGRVLLAFSDPAVRDRLLDTMDLTPRTPSSVSSRDELRRQLELVRLQGWAGQSEENDSGMAAVSVPIYSGRLIGAVTAAAPIFRASLTSLERHVPAMQEAASQLAVQLPQRN